MKRNQWMPIGLILLAIGIVLGGAWIMASTRVTGMPMMTFGSNAMMSGWTGTLMPIVMLVVFALSVAAVVSLALWIGRTVFGIEDTVVFETPDQVLKLRFAKGEITREQFNEMHETLASKPAPAG